MASRGRAGMPGMQTSNPDRHLLIYANFYLCLRLCWFGREWIGQRSTIPSSRCANLNNFNTITTTISMILSVLIVYDQHLLSGLLYHCCLGAVTTQTNYSSSGRLHNAYLSMCCSWNEITVFNKQIAVQIYSNTITVVCKYTRVYQWWIRPIGGSCSQLTIFT